MHPQHILPRLIIEQHLRPLNNPIGAQVARPLARQQRANVGPLHEVGRRVAVDVGEGAAARFVLADEVVGAVFFDQAGAVRLEVFAVRLLLVRDLNRNFISILSVFDLMLEKQTKKTHSRPRPTRHNLQRRRRDTRQQPPEGKPQKPHRD